MRAAIMTPPWVLFLSALLTLAVSAPRVDPEARWAAAVALGLCFALRQRRLLVIAGILVGVMAAGRLHALLQIGQVWDGADAPARLLVLPGAGSGPPQAWIRSLGRPAATASLRGDLAELEVGAQVWAQVQARLPVSRRNPDDRDRVRSRLARRVLFEARGEVLRHDGAVQPGVRQRIRARAATWLDTRLHGSAALWRSLLLADRGQMHEAGTERLRRLGLSHLLALSGLHVGLVLAICWLLLGRWLGPRSLVPLMVVSTWALLAGLGPSLARATGMAAWVTAARRLQRPARAVDALAVVGLCEVLIRPHVTLGIGWWLSYVATLALLRAGPLLLAAPRRRGPVAWAVAAGQGMLLAVVAQTATLPWVLDVFGRIAWYSPLVQVLVGPAFAVMMSLGLVLISAAVVVPAAEPAALLALQGITHLFGSVVALVLAASPEPWGHPGLGSWGRVVGYVGAALLLVPGLPGSWRSRGLVVLALVLCVHAPLLRGPAMSWCSLDVGQGDAGVLRVARDDWLVVDAGPAWADWDAGSGVVLPYLQRRNARGVGLLVTHGHLDHYGGARSLLDSGRFSRLLLPATDLGETWTQPLLAAAADHGVATTWLTAGDSVAVGARWLRCLWPTSAAGDLESNDRSLVVAVGHGGHDLLATGDLEAEGEEGLLQRGLARVAVLKVAHHGSDTGTTPAWLDATAPRWALISCGRFNRYGHPHPETLGALKAAGIAARRTDRNGAITVEWRGKSLRVRTVRSPP